MATVSVRGPSAVSMAKITPTCVNCTRVPAWQTGWLPSNFKDLAVSRSRQCWQPDKLALLISVWVDCYDVLQPTWRRKILFVWTQTDPCASVECLSPSVCVLDSERKPHCRCGDTCPSDFQPVCGSDGRSYSSQCHLQQEACRSQRHLRILYKGLCESGTYGLTSRNCQDFHHYKDLWFHREDTCKTYVRCNQLNKTETSSSLPSSP